MLNARQFSPPQGDESARKALIKQLRKDFPEPALAWLDSPDVQVDQPQRIPADQIDWDGYPRWRASRQLEAVVEIAKKKIHKKKGKPSVVAERPGNPDLLLIDGHHHAMARIDHKEQPLAYVVHVPAQQGPWNTLHDKQTSDKHPDDFGRTSKQDLEH